MKLYIFTLIFVFFSLTIVKNNNQKTLVYKYQIKKGESIITDEDCVLILNKNTSIFKSYASILNSRTLDRSSKTKTINSSSLIKSKVQFSIEKNNGNFSHYESVAGADIYYKSTFNSSNWTITNETKLVEGKTLSKATTNYGGRSWIAWFDLATPIANGPYIFGGLPGLIVEVHDTDSVHHFTFKGMLEEVLDKKEYEIDKNYYQKVSYKAFLKYREDAMENYYDVYNSNSPLKYPYISNEQKKKFNEKRRKNFVPIELSK